VPTVIAFHNVNDREHWLTSAKRAEVFGAIGVTGIRTFIDPTDPSRVGLLMEVPDMDAVAAMMQSPVGAEAMAYDGVVPESLVVLVES
jgi:hypothetical protein